MTDTTPTLDPMPRQTCAGCLRTVGTLPDGRTIGYRTLELPPSDLVPGRRRFHYCAALTCWARLSATVDLIPDARVNVPGERWVVRCPDGLAAHPTTFESLPAAQAWLDLGHTCLIGGAHTFHNEGRCSASGRYLGIVAAAVRCPECEARVALDDDLALVDHVAGAVAEVTR